MVVTTTITIVVVIITVVVVLFVVCVVRFVLLAQGLMELVEVLVGLIDASLDGARGEVAEGGFYGESFDLSMLVVSVHTTG